MINLKKIEGPYGIPVYFQKMPDMVRSVSMAWIMFVGGADDESVGAPGLYHWFEHIPFRGTKKYPNGVSDIKAFFASYGGYVNAYTNQNVTTYHANVPISIWKESLSRITDMMAEPLLTEESVNAEREIILQEIAERRAKSTGRAYYELSSILWPNHPFGHHVLGSQNTLMSMTPEIMKKAHAANYDRSRCSLVVFGNIDEGELITELKKLAETIPDNKLSERRSIASRGKLPAWQAGKTTIIETEFASSVVMMLFPLSEKSTNNENFFKTSVLGDMIAYGSLSSPLLKTLRGERKLVYHAGFVDNYLPEGGYYGFLAETQTKNIDAVISAFKDVLKDSSIYSEERIKEVTSGIKGVYDIRPIDTNRYKDLALYRIQETNTPYSDAEYIKNLESASTQTIKKQLQEMDPDTAHTIVWKGLGK